MPLMRRKRLPDGSLGPLEPVFNEREVIDPNLVIAFEAIAMQYETIMAQEAEINDLKARVEALEQK
jgi:hypothetical protein